MKFLLLVQEEVDRARALHGNIRSPHEALGLLDEEFEEVRKEIHKRHLDKSGLLGELVQLAAMCAKAAEDIVGDFDAGPRQAEKAGREAGRQEGGQQESPAVPQEDAF